MKKIILLSVLFFSLSAKAQVWDISFGTSTGSYMCNPPVYTIGGQSQCIHDLTFLTPTGVGVGYTTTTASTVGTDCRNSIRLENPGKVFIGTNTELQLRNAGNGATPLNPARFVVKNFTPGLRFGAMFDIALAGLGGSYYFRCGSGEAYGDTTFMVGRDSSSAVVIKINDENPAITQASLGYCNSSGNPSWPSAPSYFWASGVNPTIFTYYQKHTVAVFFNNSSVNASYNYLGLRTLSPSSYDVYVDSILDVSNMLDNFFQNGRGINSFMFGGGSALCANGGDYLGDTLIVDNVRWTNDFSAFPLPVHLTSFTAQQSGNNVLLSWRDETPEDGVKFEVQVSNDGRNFRSIGQVVESVDKKDYSFLYPNPDCGKLFFRLHFENNYSKVVPLNIPCLGPKIIAGKQSLTITTKLPGTLVLTNLYGQILARTVLASGSSQISFTIPVGVYVAKFIDKNGNVSNQKVLIE